MVVDAMQKERENIQDKLSGHVTNDVANIVPSQVDSFLRDYMSNHILHVHLTSSFERPTPLVKTYKVVVRTRDYEDHHDDDAHPKGESSAKRLGMSKQAMDESNPSGLGTQEKLDEFDAWMDDFGIDDDEVPSQEVLPKLLEEVSRKVDELQMQNDANDMLRERCNSREEHQYHLD
nr:hypothetical protein [Tanacetum cinerariifolium]